MKKLSLLLLLLLLSTLVVIGCGTPTTAPSEPVKSIAPGAPATGTLLPGSTAQPVTPAKSQAPGATAAPAKPAPATPVYGGNIKWIEASAPGGPIGTSWDSPAGNPCQALCLESFFIQLLDGSYVPRLATSYQSNPKEPSITFNLRKGVKFHDGTDFNAQTAKWVLDKGKASGVWPGYRWNKSVDVIDDYTIRINLTMWRNSLMPIYTANQSYQYSPATFEKYGNEWMKWNMVGTGPFKQTSFQRDVSLTTVRNDDYWDKGKPYLFGAQYLFVADELTRLALFKTGGADILNSVGNARIASELKAEGYVVASLPSGADAMVPDSANADSPWANLKVRQAAEYAIDKEAIAKAFGYGFWRGAYQLPSPENQAYNPAIVGRKYDPAKAKQLLSEAGFPSGFKTKIIAPSSANRDVMVALQSYFSAVGIQADLDFPEPAKYTEISNGTWNNGLVYTTMTQPPNYNMSFGLSMPPEPRANFKSLKNPAGWLDLYNATMTSAEVDPKLQQKCIQAMYDDLSMIPVVYKTSQWILRKGINDYGLGQNNFQSWIAQNTWFSK